MRFSQGWGFALKVTASRLLLVTKAMGIPLTSQCSTSSCAQGIALAWGSSARTIGC